MNLFMKMFSENRTNPRIFVRIHLSRFLDYITNEIAMAGTASEIYSRQIFNKKSVNILVILDIDNLSFNQRYF